MPNDVIANIADHLNKGKKTSALGLVQQNPQVAAVISKLIRPGIQSNIDAKNPKSLFNINTGQIKAISDNIIERHKNNDYIIQLFPDVELSIQILVTSIMSPKDMVNLELIYKTKESNFPPEVTAKLLKIIESTFNTEYNVLDEIEDILRDTLFNTGSYVKAILPESVVDSIINGDLGIGKENLSEIFEGSGEIVSQGFLGNPTDKTIGSKGIGLEYFDSNVKKKPYDPKVIVKEDKHTIDLGLEVIDNYKFLKVPFLAAKSDQDKIDTIIQTTSSLKNVRSFGMEADKINPNKLEGLLYKDPNKTYESVLVIPSKENTKRKTIGRPLIMKLPSESVIPVHVPGNPKEHVAYFIVLDQDGNPITEQTEYGDRNSGGLSSYFNNAKSGNLQSNDLSSLLLNKAKKNLIGQDTIPTIDQLTSIYSSIVEKDLLDRLSNGLFNRNLEISKNDVIYRIMLSRALASKFTRVVFVPAKLMSYFAFRYFDNGIGKSLLDEVRILCSLRAIILFAKIMAQTKNSIATTHVNMTLDPNDPDPQKVIDIAMHDIIKIRQQYFPLGINSPLDLVDWIQRAGLEFTFENHPGLPQTKFDFEQKNSNFTVPDSDLDESLRKQTIMAFSLSPEMVDNGFNSEFATTAVQNNILLSKRVLQTQMNFTRQLSDYMRKVMKNDANILRDLKKIIVDNIEAIKEKLTPEEKEALNNDQEFTIVKLVEDFIDLFIVELPKPDTTTIDTQTKAFTDYADAVDKAIEYVINTDILSENVIGSFNSNVDNVKAIVKCYVMRKWMADNGYLTELLDISNKDADSDKNIDLLEINKNYIETIGESVIKFMRSMKPIADAANQDQEELGIAEGQPSSMTNSSENTTSEEGSSDDSGSSDFDMGGLDLDMGSTDTENNNQES